MKEKVMVVSGGPAGMMATQTLIQRGHEVILFEKSEQLGGLSGMEYWVLQCKEKMSLLYTWYLKRTDNSYSKSHSI